MNAQKEILPYCSSPIGCSHDCLCPHYGQHDCEHRQKIACDVKLVDALAPVIANGTERSPCPPGTLYQASPGDYIQAHGGDLDVTGTFFILLRKIPSTFKIFYPQHAWNRNPRGKTLRPASESVKAAEVP
ncbi:MAG: hypothetical protein LBG69_04610 [Zoogloeaceae bacterium]|nr:hypothetical protein [Zoogloeaceae bacterium]